MRNCRQRYGRLRPKIGQLAFDRVPRPPARMMAKVLRVRWLMKHVGLLAHIAICLVWAVVRDYGHRDLPCHRFDLYDTATGVQMLLSQALYLFNGAGTSSAYRFSRRPWTATGVTFGSGRRMPAAVCVVGDFNGW